MTEKENTEQKNIEESDKSKGPYTPLRSPENIENLSGGEWQWKHSSDRPIEEKE
jgi:hypothetical protein